eukprot:6023978-Pyramimonas_sp.AAC.1
MGGGGKWRAFVRHHSIGTAERPDLRRIGELYRARDKTGPEEMRLAAAAARATRSHRAGGASFGPTTRDVQRFTSNKIMKALVDRYCSGAESTISVLPLLGGTFSPSSCDAD